MENKKGNILLALLMSMLAALGGGIFFGLIYFVGYYIYLLPAAAIVLACGVFFKFYKNVNWKTMTLAIIWSVVWTFIFNIFAVLIVEAIWIAKEYSTSFSVSYSLLIELWKTEPEIKSYMNARMLQIAGMILLGGVLYGTLYTVNYFKAKKAKKAMDNNNVSTPTANNEILTKQVKQTEDIKTEETTKEPIKTTAEVVYSSALNECRNAILKLMQTKDQETFKKEVKEIQTKYISKLSIPDKDCLIMIINSEVNKESLSSLDKKANQTLLKIIK